MIYVVTLSSFQDVPNVNGHVTFTITADVLPAASFQLGVAADPAGVLSIDPVFISSVSTTNTFNVRGNGASAGSATLTFTSPVNGITVPAPQLIKVLGMPSILIFPAL